MQIVGKKSEQFQTNKMSIITRVTVRIISPKLIGNTLTVPKSGVVPLSRLSSSLTADKPDVFKEPESLNTDTVNDFEAKRNKSRLRKQHYKMLHGQMHVDLENPFFPYEKTVIFRRKLIAKHGLETGINLGIAWPTREELSDHVEYEKVAHPFTIQEMVEKKRKLREEERNKIMERQKEINFKMGKLASWMKELRDKNQKKEDTARAAQEKKDALIEEVRQHFGYVVNMKDPKFQEMIVQKEKEAKKAEKELKKKVRTERNVVKAMAMAEKVAENENKPE